MEEYGDRVQFFIVYTREAHASDGQRPREGNVEVEEPTSLDERAEVAQTCSVDLGLRLPMLIDNMENEVEQAYDSWPDRLYLIDAEGRIAFKGDHGPRGFLPDRLEAAIRELLE